MSKRPIIVERHRGHLVPKTAEDMELIESYPEKADLEITIKQSRSLPQLNLYWATLDKVVKATGSHPSSDHLDDAIKIDLGYVRPVRTLRGTLRFVPDSIALRNMTQPEFQAYFDAAMKLLAETFGFDPLSEAA